MLISANVAATTNKHLNTNTNTTNIQTQIKYEHKKIDKNKIVQNEQWPLKNGANIPLGQPKIALI